MRQLVLCYNTYKLFNFIPLQPKIDLVMAKGRKPRWKRISFENGIVIYELLHWKYFDDFIQSKLLNTKNYIYRGQRNDAWQLEPTLIRQVRKSRIPYAIILKNHLENFKYSSRGRASYLKEILNDENELWSIGQHNQLVTPLLDFTYSPYVAAYFAFYQESFESNFRIVYALSQNHVINQINDLVELYKPLSGHNPRLLNQSGLFVKFKVNDPLETCISRFCLANPDLPKKGKLMIIRIPNRDREVCLKSLNKMNINHNSLFPDLYGASIYCNTMLDIDNY